MDVMKEKYSARNIDQYRKDMAAQYARWPSAKLVKEREDWKAIRRSAVERQLGADKRVSA
jgi:hypothetical protein